MSLCSSVTRVVFFSHMIFGVVVGWRPWSCAPPLVLCDHLIVVWFVVVVVRRVHGSCMLCVVTSNVLIIFNSPTLTRILRIFEINSNSFDSNRRQYWPHSHLIHLIRITAKIGHIHIEFTFTFNPSSPPTRTRAKYVSHQPDRRAARRHEGAVRLFCVRLYRGVRRIFGRGVDPCRCRCVLL